MSIRDGSCPTCADKKVLRLDVSMDYILLMTPLHSLDELANVLPHLK
jgi:hypothetical protein